MTEQKLTKLYHPSVRNSEAEVPASDVERWTDQGWRKTKPDLSDGVAAPVAKKTASPRAARKRAATKKAADAPSVLHPGAG